MQARTPPPHVRVPRMAQRSAAAAKRELQWPTRVRPHLSWHGRAPLLPSPTTWQTHAQMAAPPPNQKRGVWQRPSCTRRSRRFVART